MTVLHDLRFAVRQLRKNPGFACTAIVVLALGLAASVAIFAFVDAALLQPLPYRDPSQLVSLYETSGTCRDCALSYPDYLDWKKDNTVFSSIEAWEFTVHLWKSSAGVQALRAARVSGGFFHTLGVSAAMGRTFTDVDDRPSAPRTVLLPYATWQSRFGGRPDVVGQSIILDGDPHIVIGVLPRDFHFALRAAELWTTIHDLSRCEQTRTCRDINAIARLRDGVSIPEALANTKAIAAHLAAGYPASNKGRTAHITSLRDAIVGDIRPTLLLLLTGSVLLLLIACVNVASLVLVRAEVRRREMALRGALGASLTRLVRLFVSEGLVLAAVAIALGLTAAYVTIPWLFRLIPERVLRGTPYFFQVGLHPRTLLFAGLSSLLAVVVFSVTPAFRVSLSNLRDELAHGGRTAAGATWKRFGSNLVAAELAIAMVLLAGAGLLAESLYRLFHVDLNFDPAHVATLEIDTHGASYNTEEQRIALSHRLLDHIATLPGVLSVAHASDLPITCNCNATAFRVSGHPWSGEQDRVLERTVTADYFKVFRARLIRGRIFAANDDQSRPHVALINRSLARRFFPGEDPIGRVTGDANLSPESLRRVIGVIDDIREGKLNEPIEPAVYYPFDQNPSAGTFLAVRTAPEPAPMLPVLFAAIHRVDPNLGVRNEFTMPQRIDNSVFLERSSAWLLGGFAGLALLLGIIGLYGVIAYSVTQRTREIGVRIALGAQRAAVYRLILGEAGFLAALGIALGLACSIPAASLLRGLLFGVGRLNPPVLMAVALILAACALLASYLPARRAASVNPVEALRAE